MLDSAVPLATGYDPAGRATGPLRAFLKFGAGTLAHQHLALALACDCTKIICISRGLTPDLVNFQHDVERAGARFHLITGARGLAGLVTANDELVVIADGLLVQTAKAQALLCDGQGVIVQPVESGIAAGFERIDADHASAGLMRIPGRLAEQLNILPADCDVASALTRIALQAGVAQRLLPEDESAGSREKFLRDQNEADVVEAEWLDRQLRGNSVMTKGPGSWLAQLCARAIGPAVLHGGNGSKSFALAFAALTLLGLAFGWFGFTMLSLCSFGLAWVAGRGSGILRQVERVSLALSAETRHRAEMIGGLLDAAIVAVLAQNMPVFAGDSGWHRLFAPIMLIIVLRLLPRVLHSCWTDWLTDRFLLCLFLGLAAGAGWLQPIVLVLSVSVGLLGIFWPRKGTRLT